MEEFLVDANGIEAQAWRNGGGQTRELLAWPSARDWIFRISLAQVAKDGPFSSFPGIERWIALVEGAGMTLQFEHGAERLTIDRDPLRFDGALAPGCSLDDGATTDLNLMVDRKRGTGWMRRACGAAWVEKADWRGIFTATGCTLDIEGRAARELDAMSLLLLAGQQERRWQLTEGDAPLRAWWVAVRTSIRERGSAP